MQVASAVVELSSVCFATHDEAIDRHEEERQDQAEDGDCDDVDKYGRVAILGNVEEAVGVRADHRTANERIDHIDDRHDQSCKDFLGFKPASRPRNDKDDDCQDRRDLVNQRIAHMFPATIGDIRRNDGGIDDAGNRNHHERIDA